MPHWINLSFYSMEDRISSEPGTFKPRANTILRMAKEGTEPGGDRPIQPFMKLPNPNIKIPLIVEDDDDPFADTFTIEDSTPAPLPPPLVGAARVRNMSLNDSISSRASVDLTLTPQRKAILGEISSSSVVRTPKKSASGGAAEPASEEEESNMNVELVGYGSTFNHQSIKKYLLRPGRALTNPFDPSDTKARMSSNRRRWTHIFTPTVKSVKKRSVIEPPKASAKAANGIWSESPSTMLIEETTGMDWKSLTIPASLPITTDFFPDKRSISNDYFFNEYRLNPVDINDGRPPLTTEQIYQELLSQRLAQGFQLIVPSKGGQPFPELPISGKLRAEKGTKEHWFSIGKIFHKIAICPDGSEIAVTKNQPKKPLRDQRMDYRYRFQAPDNDSYELSWVEFNTEKLENFNWNRVDFYICTRGDREYALMQNQKYWRLRIHLLPLTFFLPYTKKIMEGTERCDIYPLEVGAAALAAQEGFPKFIETCVNRLKKKPRVSQAAVQEPGSDTGGDGAAPQLDSRDNTTAELCAAMASPSNGVNQFTRGKCHQVFLAFEAVDWLHEHVSGLTSKEQALNLLRVFMSERLVRHISRNTDYSLTYGIAVLEFVPPAAVQSGKGSRGQVVPQPSGEEPDCEEDWVEVQFSDTKNIFHKLVTIDIDQSSKSDRPEWGHLKYLSHFNPENAFELSLEWTVATGALVADLVNSWARKAQQNNMSLIPVPGDPFALPITANSDPIRGPIFVAMDVMSVQQTQPGVSDDAVFNFRKAIAKKFGFIRCSLVKRPESSTAAFSTDHQHIHCTGNMYLLIPAKMKNRPGGVQGIKGAMDGAGTLPQQQPLEGESRFLEKAKPAYDHSKTGFLWSWNFMLSRRWKQACNTGATGDIPFMDQMLADFRKFCANDEGRLLQFWQEWREMEAVERGEAGQEAG